MFILTSPTSSILEPDFSGGVAEASAYCRRLAESHYENFTVVSWLLPKPLRPHFHHVYAYCRGADDLADESGQSATARAGLDAWEAELHACYEGKSRHPVFLALAETVREFQIPREPFLDLLSAFRQDQEVVRYATREAVLDYCRRSADPVGRIVLYLGRCQRAPLTNWSDKICTGLQLANFCQDVAEDWDRGRIYLPQTTLDQVGYTEEYFARRECNAAFRKVMAQEVAYADSFFQAGLPLISALPKSLRLDVALCLEGGRAILDTLRRRSYDVWHGRPKLNKWDRVKIAGRAARHVFRARRSERE